MKLSRFLIRTDALYSVHPKRNNEIENNNDNQTMSRLSLQQNDKTVYMERMIKFIIKLLITIISPGLVCQVESSLILLFFFFFQSTSERFFLL